MVNRLTTTQSTLAMRRWGPSAIVMLTAMAALAALNADAAARQARPAPATEATAPRDAGEPIMAIVSIKTQQVTFYDADGWILRAPVFWIPAGPKATSKPTTPAARKTDRNNGAGTVEIRRVFIIPASLKPDCTAKHADAPIVRASQ